MVPDHASSRTWRLLADENFNGKILRGLERRVDGLDIVRVQDTDLLAAADPQVLEWAAREKRVILTHDVNTMVRDAYDRIVRGEPMAGMVLVAERAPIGRCLDDLRKLVVTTPWDGLRDQVLFLPLPR